MILRFNLYGVDIDPRCAQIVFLSSFQKWREEVLLPKAPPVVFADLGYGVLDNAMVEVAAYCLEKRA